MFTSIFSRQLEREYLSCSWLLCGPGPGEAACVGRCWSICLIDGVRVAPGEHIVIHLLVSWLTTTNLRTDTVQLSLLDLAGWLPSNPQSSQSGHWTVQWHGTLEILAHWMRDWLWLFLFPPDIRHYFSGSTESPSMSRSCVCLWSDDAVLVCCCWTWLILSTLTKPTVQERSRALSVLVNVVLLSDCAGVMQVWPSNHFISSFNPENKSECFQLGAGPGAAVGLQEN